MDVRGRLALALAATLSLTFAALALAAEGQLSFVNCLKDTGSASSCSAAGGVDGLDGANGATTSSDGKSVYVASRDDNAVAVFSRNPTTGALTYVEVQKDGVGGVDGLSGAAGVTTSPDGKNVYVTGFADDAVAVFSRNPTTGALTYVGVQKDGVGGVDGLDTALGVITSSDGKSVYVASRDDNAVAVFSRNPTTGALTFVEVQKDGVGGVDGLGGASKVSSSPDGKSVYVASLSDDAVAVFSRDPTTGDLSFVEAKKDTDAGVDGLDGAYGVTTSADGKSVYVASYLEDAVAAFSRNPNTGALTYVEAQKDGIDGVDGLNEANGVTTSPDGKSVYVASGTDDAVAVFSRNPTTGALSYVEAKKDGVGSVDGLDGASEVTTSPDGKSVYVTARYDNAVATFAREADTTAPDTTIDVGPTGNTTETSPIFGFSSGDPGFTEGFECRVDGGAFTPCSSPKSVGPLNLGPHTFEVRAIDTAGNADPSPALRSFAVVASPSPPDPDTEVTDPDVSAKKTQRLHRQVKVKVKAGAQEPVDLVGKGKVTVKKAKKGGKKGRAGKSKSFNLKTVRKSTDQGEQTVLRLKPKKEKDAKKILKLLKKGKDLRANPSVKLTDEAGNSVTEKRVVRLKLKGGKRRR